MIPFYPSWRFFEWLLLRFLEWLFFSFSYFYFKFPFSLLYLCFELVYFCEVYWFPTIWASLFIFASFFFLFSSRSLLLKFFFLVLGYYNDSNSRIIFRLYLCEFLSDDSNIASIDFFFYLWLDSLLISSRTSFLMVGFPFFSPNFNVLLYLFLFLLDSYSLITKYFFLFDWSRIEFLDYSSSYEIIEKSFEFPCFLIEPIPVSWLFGC